MSKRSTHINTILTLCVGCVLLALTALASQAGAATAPPLCGVEAQRAHACLVTQCPTKVGQRSECLTFVIAAYPKAGELGEATADQPYVVTTCILRHGNANQCARRIVAEGDQIIAPAWH